MIEPMTLSGVLMNVLGALPQKGGANDQLRNDLWGEIVRGPQDEASMSARVGSLIDGAKISPARAHELFKSEVQLDLGRKGTPHQQQIMRHTLNNMRSFGANSRQQVQAAILAADKGWDLSADELTGKLPPDPSSAPPRLRPFVNLLVRAEQENDPEAFVKAAGLAYGVLSGSGMAQLRQDLIRDGHARSAALVGLIFSTPRPPGESAAEVLDLKRNMAAAYAVALANDGIEEFLQDLEDGAHQNDQQAAGMRLEDKVAMLTLKAKIAMASGEIGSTPDRPATPESIAFLEAYERAIDPIRRRAKRNSTLATFNEQYSKWLRSLASAVRSTPVPPRVIPPGQRTVTLQDGTVVSVGDEPYRGDPNPGAADVNPYAPDYVPPPDDAAQASTPEPGDIPDNIRAGLTDYYKTLLDPDTLTRYRDQFLIQRHRIAGASSAGDQKAAIQSLNIAREYLERADAMLKVLSGRSAKGPFEKYIRQAMVDNLKAITDAAAAGKTVVSLKNPMNGDEEIWPVTPGDQDEVAQSPPTPWPPPRPPTLTEMSMAALTKSSSEVASLNQDIDEIAKALGIQSKNANFTVLKAKALDSGTRSFKLAKREAAIANNFTGFRSAIELTFKFEQTHYVLSHAGKEMSVPTTLQRANVQRILTATKSKATLADVTGPYETMTKQQLQQLLSSMPSEGKMMDLTKNDSPIKVQFSVEPGGAGMNVSEFYGAMNLINAVRYSAQKSTEGEGSTGPTGPNDPKAKTATPPPPLSGGSGPFKMVEWLDLVDEPIKLGDTTYTKMIKVSASDVVLATKQSPLIVGDGDSYGIWVPVKHATLGKGFYRVPIRVAGIDTADQTSSSQPWEDDKMSDAAKKFVISELNNADDVAVAFGQPGGNVLDYIKRLGGPARYIANPWYERNGQWYSMAEELLKHTGVGDDGQTQPLARKTSFPMQLHPEDAIVWRVMQGKGPSGNTLVKASQSSKGDGYREPVLMMGNPPQAVDITQHDRGD